MPTYGSAPIVVRPSWSKLSVQTRNGPMWPYHAVSADGSKMIASVRNGGKLWRSTDSGSSWSQLSVNASDLTSFLRVDMSNAGSVMVAMHLPPTNSYLLAVWKSTDGGDTWSEETGFSQFGFSHDMDQIAMSGDGSKIVTLGGGGAVAVWTGPAAETSTTITSSTTLSSTTSSSTASSSTTSSSTASSSSSTTFSTTSSTKTATATTATSTTSLTVTETTQTVTETTKTVTETTQTVTETTQTVTETVTETTTVLEQAGNGMGLSTNCMVATFALLVLLCQQTG
ncbi:unnamed protein product [Symbiodinium natans]|uniref:Uncharacterized protein n=1 Tax=Symbiodinium natans TaxID=878477 RepID=A0A812SJN1_9DINO|nr:unnamed protein product [Symbiodinium natans]